jgi:hypothetical protein
MAADENEIGTRGFIGTFILYKPAEYLTNLRGDLFQATEHSIYNKEIHMYETEAILVRPREPIPDFVLQYLNDRGINPKTVFIAEDIDYCTNVARREFHIPPPPISKEPYPRLLDPIDIDPLEKAIRYRELMRETTQDIGVSQGEEHTLLAFPEGDIDHNFAQAVSELGIDTHALMQELDQAPSHDLPEIHHDYDFGR